MLAIEVTSKEKIVQGSQSIMSRGAYIFKEDMGQAW